MADPEGTPIWFELTTADRDRAEQFYAAVAEWQIAASPMPEHGGYRVCSAPDGGGIAGLMTPPAGLAALPGWLIYFGTADVDVKAEQVKQAGGSVLFGPMDIPHVGRFATCADPQGITFNVMTGASADGSTAFRQMESGAIDGHGVWIELATPNPDAALAFYGALFGWSKQGAMPMGDMGEYAFFGTGESRPGAVMSSATTGSPARWNWYVHVPDIDVAIETANAQGGSVLQGPDPIPGGEYSANLSDPEGSRIGLVGPRRQGEA